MGFSRRKPVQYCGLPTGPFASSPDFCYNKWGLKFKMLARIRHFHNFCTIVKERNETRRTKYRRMISQFCRDQLNCLSTNQPKDDRTFRASTSIISCLRERIFYAISVVDNDRYFKNTKSFGPTREVLSTHHIWYDWRQPKHSFLLMKKSPMVA